MTPVARALVWPFALLCAALASGSAQAALFWVGSDPGCTHATLQAAINAAQANGPGEDEIRVRAGTFLNQGLSIDDHSLVITGGWNGCGGGAQQTTRSVLSAGPSAGTYGTTPVFQIRVLATAQSVSLRNLVIQDGYSQFTDGGGIRVEGRASVYLENVLLEHNYSTTHGGGIYVNGFGVNARATVELHRDVTVSNNRADVYGGGIYGRHANIRIRSDRTDIVGNLAGFGGGIAAWQSGITVGAVGQPVPYHNATGATIRQNQAVRGGGVYLWDYAAFDARELSLVGNIATHAGSAGSGGGIYATDNAFVRMARDYPDSNSVSCPADQNCSRIVGNRAGDGCPGSGGHGGGAYFDGAGGFFYQTLFLENCAYGSPALTSWGPTLVLEGVVVAKNRLAFRTGGDQTGRHVVSHASRANAPTAFSDIRFSTFSDNVEVMANGSTAPATATHLHAPGTGWNQEVLATAFADPVTAAGGVSAFGPCNLTQLQAGHFANPAGNDYRPTLAGFLVDACALSSIIYSIQYTDPRRVERCQNHSRPDQGGHCDIGAYELPSDIPADRIFANGFQ